MKIYFGNLPGRVSKLELSFFIHSHQRHRLLALLLNEVVEVSHCEIVKTVSETGQVACYGVAQIFPRKNAVKLIERLNGKPLKGKPVQVREYFVRKQARDRRSQGWELEALDIGFDRRKKERRITTRLDDWKS